MFVMKIGLIKNSARFAGTARPCCRGRGLIPVTHLAALRCNNARPERNVFAEEIFNKKSLRLEAFYSAKRSDIKEST